MLELMRNTRLTNFMATSIQHLIHNIISFRFVYSIFEKQF